MRTNIKSQLHVGTDLRIKLVDWLTKLQPGGRFEIKMIPTQRYRIQV